jgi:hypothetical protein
MKLARAKNVAAVAADVVVTEEDAAVTVEAVAVTAVVKPLAPQEHSKAEGTTLCLFGFFVVSDITAE